jgi:hypothetical protein
MARLTYKCCSVLLPRVSLVHVATDPDGCVDVGIDVFPATHSWEQEGHLTKCSMHAHDDLALHRQLTFMRMQQMLMLPVDVNSVLCKTADECCSVTGRSGETARKCKQKIAHSNRDSESHVCGDRL